MIHILYSHATKQQIDEMLATLETYIKLAVDIKREILAGGGTLHPDCEAALLEVGSQQDFIWGAEWISSIQQIRYEALINIRPNKNNPVMDILDSSIRNKIDKIVQNMLGGI